MSCILVVHQRSDIRLSLSLLLKQQGYDVLEATDVHQARATFRSHSISLTLLDIDECIHASIAKTLWKFVTELKTNFSELRIMALTSWQHKALVNTAAEQGINGFLSKPWKNQQVIQEVAQQLHHASQLNQYKKQQTYLIEQAQDYYAWQSHSMQKAFRQVNSLNSHLPFYVLSGESGTGKKTLAQYIHQNSIRKKALFITLDCATVTAENQLEPWLEPMSFIGQGTLVLKQIEKLSFAYQHKLLHWLLDNQRGDTHPACVVLVCYQKLSALVKAELLLPELFKFLKINEINLPVLNQRQDDIVPLLQFMLDKKSDRTTLSLEAQQALQEHHWLLNIKELSLIVDKIIALPVEHVSGSELRLKILNSAGDKGIALPMLTLEQAEIALLKQALQVTNNNIPKAAELLGLTKSSMYRRVDKYALVQK